MQQLSAWFITYRQLFQTKSLNQRNQKQREKKLAEKLNIVLLHDHLKTISDNQIILGLDDVIAGRKIRNQFMQYIGHNFHQSYLRPGKKVITNSADEQNDEQYISQLLQSNGTRIIKTTSQE